MSNVSVITPAYNSLPFIKEAYESLSAQKYSGWEWVVTDDCSDDGTWEFLQKLAQTDSRVIVLRNDVNSGAAISRNKSIDRASGEYLAFLDSDDLWLPNKLELQLSYMKANQIDFCFTAYELIDEAGSLMGVVVDSSQADSLDYEDMLKKKATLGCSTVMLSRDRVGISRMPILRTGQDYAFWLLLLRSGIRAHPYTEVLTKYRIVNNSISRNKFKKAKRQWKIYRDVESLGLIKSAACFLFYAWRAVFRR
ncbi:glycosyltransferase family 2 protein [Marinagarivorans algicola]|uniref:glycosyltransferase family 2 protein n=1 Tax=Marinagarivorans algicola TaxID=1513270 RepID=UPI0006B5FA5C|nr:glycosyltransferase family 2 protein [Marinagarivorans algicola]